VILVPESGDSVQAMKAGLMEVADIFVVNKADREGAHALMAELRFSVHLHYTSSVSPKDIDWEIPILAAQATNDVGVAELLGEVKRHRSVLEASGALEKRRRARRRADLRMLLTEEFAGRVMAMVERDPELAATIEAVSDGKLDAYSGVDRILARLLRQP
jgi:LAO/AO transport system kinase